MKTQVWRNLPEPSLMQPQLEKPRYERTTIPGMNALATHLYQRGGLAQQDRMIRDKRKTLDRAVLYSYQGAQVRKWYPDESLIMDTYKEMPPARALINPNKLKQDYDDKIISVGYEWDFHTGDVFEWLNTGTYWLIYLQDLTELAYFRGEIRKCSYEIEWLDENGEKKKTKAAVRGPVETKIDYIQKHGISVDNPNYSLNILIPLNEDTEKQFKRYAKFYLPNDETCWRIEAVDKFNMAGVLEFNAVEYYANMTEDDVENGLVGAFISIPEDPNEGKKELIIGETFIKPRTQYNYSTKIQGTWTFDNDKLPIKYTTLVDEDGNNIIKLKWDSSYTGQFVLKCGKAEKTIVVESLF